MASTTSHWDLPFPDGTDDIAQGDDEIALLATALDDVTKFTTGAFTSRPLPAASKAGMHYISNDVTGGRVDFYDGTTWLQVYPPSSTQTGDLKLSAVATEPTGWLKCDGRAVSRTTYANLYAALGGASSPHGQGDGSTTFNLPDFAGRAVMGSGSGTGLTARAVGDKVGEETHQLTGPEGPAHTHANTLGTGAVGSHSHGGAVTVGGGHAHGLTGSGYVPGGYGSIAPMQIVGTAGGFEGIIAGNGLVAGVTVTDVGGDHNHGISADGGHSHSITGSITATAAATGHNNVQPSNVATVLVKT